MTIPNLPESVQTTLAHINCVYMTTLGSKIQTNKAETVRGSKRA